METTADETRSAATTSAVRRDASTLPCASAVVRAAVCAPAEDTVRSERESRHPSSAAPIARGARLDWMRRSMRLPDSLQKQLWWVAGRDEVETLGRSRW